MATVDELKKLNPQERIEKLRELEEERKREIEQAEELIKKTAEEIAEAEEKKKIPIPQARVTDLSTLATTEEKQMVSVHHLLPSEAEPELSLPQKRLEEVAAEEAPKITERQQPQRFQKPEYALGTESQRSAFGDYLSRSQQTVTSAGMSQDGSPIEERITDFYRDKAVTGAEAGNPQQKYFSTHQQVTGGYEMKKREETERKEQSRTYERKGGGPA